MKKKYIIIVALVMFFSGMYSVSKAVNLSDLEQQKEQIKEQLNEVNTGLEDVQLELTEALEAINKIEAKIIEGEASLETTKNEMSKLEQEVKQIQEMLVHIQKDYSTQKKILEKRLVAVYKMGDTTYLDVLLKSKSITDFISRYFLIEEITEYDGKLLESIEREKNKITEINVQLNEKSNNLKKMKENQEKTLISLENARTIKNSYLEDLTEEELNIQKQVEEYNQKLDNIDAQMAILAMVNGNSEFIGGEFLWPAPGNTIITSPFGMRFHPILHYYRSHNGIDIGTPTGAPIVASNPGTVITASYVGSYGNVVMLDHGGGVVTNYAHGSKILVEVGQTVQRGEIIMEAGSTGLSTGPHLHFEIKINGKFVDPLPYVKGK